MASQGKHWTAEKIARTFAPSQTADQLTIDWLTQSGVERQRIERSASHWITFNSTVGEAEQLFHTKYYRFEHSVSRNSRIASDNYSLPDTISRHVDFIMPTIHLDGLQPLPQANRLMTHETFDDIKGMTNSTDKCYQITTIDCLRAMYKIPIPKTAHKDNLLGIAEWADYLWNPDLDVFFANLTNPIIPQGVRPEFISIDGGKPGTYERVQSVNNVESGLDVQVSYSIIYPQNVRLYQVGDGVNMDSGGTFNLFLDALDASYCTYKGGNQPYIDPIYPDLNDGGWKGPLQCGGAPVSNVVSISYGQIEGILPRFYQERQCYEWAKLALQGVSVIFASGDTGVATAYNIGFDEVCLDENEPYLDVKGKRFAPGFPVNCPYVTAVGATMLLTHDIKDGERAVDRFGSGGGFSEVFPAPAYQMNAVQNYLKQYAPKSYGPKVFNRKGRGFPDVAASGDRVALVSDGKIRAIGGTSAAAPIFASIITLLNEERLALGKKSIGFLNPTMYMHPEMFNDITVGNSPGCGTDGFPASKGWDPVTGLGTPNYEKMREVFVKALP